MSLTFVLVLLAAGLVLSLLAFFFLSRSLAKREPYLSFLKLRGRAKLRFFRLILGDKRVPLAVKAIPLLLIPYLAMPFDIVPDFIPVLGYVDDVAIVLGTLALIIKLTPRTVVDELMIAAGSDSRQAT